MNIRGASKIENYFRFMPVEAQGDKVFQNGLLYNNHSQTKNIRCFVIYYTGKRSQQHYVTN